MEKSKRDVASDDEDDGDDRRRRQNKYPPQQGRFMVLSQPSRCKFIAIEICTVQFLYKAK